MVLPFRRGHQEALALELAAAIDAGGAPIVRLVRFPRISIDHALLLFGDQDRGSDVRFDAYDPNHAEAPRSVVFDRESCSFWFPQNESFEGGRVNVLEIYRDALR